MNGTSSMRRALLWPSRGWLGLILLAICWPLNWTLPGMRTAYLFFPLWLGYVLLMDGLVFARMGASLYSRSRRDFLLLFLVSAPVWWLFEVINSRTENWQYQGSDTFSQIEYYLLSSLSFSTVMPAVFESAEWIRTFRWMERFATRWPVAPSRRLSSALLLCGM